MHNQWWSDAPCWWQVGQAARCPRPYDGVHMPGKWPRRVELHCSLAAARSVFEAIVRDYEGLNSVLLFPFRLTSLLCQCCQTSASWMVCTMRWTRNFPSAMTKATWWTAPATARAADGGSATPSVCLLFQLLFETHNALIVSAMTILCLSPLQISVKNHRLKPSIRLETPGTKSFITFTTGVTAMAMELERWDVNLSEPTTVGGKLTTKGRRQPCLIGSCFCRMIVVDLDSI